MASTRQTKFRLTDKDLEILHAVRRSLGDKTTMADAVRFATAHYLRFQGLEGDDTRPSNLEGGSHDADGQLTRT